VTFRSCRSWVWIQIGLPILLGDGSYSSVYKVKRTEDGLEYALKKVKISHLSDREKENALNEVRILASIKHKSVASYKQAFFDEPSSSLW
jgi:NIMA (never in mitosis gene a)-related kinase 1/4/5